MVRLLLLVARMISSSPGAQHALPCAPTDIKMFCMAKTKLGELYFQSSRYREAASNCFPAIGKSRNACQVTSQDLEKAYQLVIAKNSNAPGNFAALSLKLKSRSRKFMERKAILEDSCFQCVKLHCREQEINRLEAAGVQWDREPEQQCVPRHAQWLHPELTFYHRPSLRIQKVVMTPEKVVIVTSAEKAAMRKDVSLMRTGLQVHNARIRGQQAKQRLNLVSTYMSNTHDNIFPHSELQCNTMQAVGIVAHVKLDTPLKVTAADHFLRGALAQAQKVSHATPFYLITSTLHRFVYANYPPAKFIKCNSRVRAD